MLNIGLEQQQQIRGGDGTILWSGGQAVATSYIVTSNEASATASMGEAMTFDPQTSALGFIPRLETTAAGATPASDLPGVLVIGALRTPASAGASVPFLGVAQEAIKAGGKGFVAGAGSLTTVLVTTAALTLGLKVGTSATAGLCAAVTASTTVGFVLGICLKINTTGATGTNSTSFAGILVNPC
jgi:hypothetical protein